MCTGSPGTSCVAAVALRLDSYSLGVVLLLLGDAPELLGGVPIYTYGGIAYFCEVATMFRSYPYVSQVGRSSPQFPLHVL